MTERIRELAEQCYEYKAEMLDIWFNKEKFAELIVRECVEVINAGKNVWTGTDVPAGVALDLAGKNVKAYFGVEE